MDTDRTRRIRHPSPLRWLTLLSLVVGAATLVFGIAILVDMRRDARTQAETATSNLAAALSADIARNIDLYDRSIQGAIDAWDRYDIQLISPETRQMALFDNAAAADYLGSLVVADASGTVVASSVTATLGLSVKDRDYFRVQQTRVDAGLYISLPFRSQLRHADPTIAVSRRIFGHDGRFGGIAVGTVRLAFFRHLFEHLDLGAQGTVAVLRTDGHLIVRNPFNEADIDRDYSAAPVFQQFLKAPAGSIVGTATEGIQRLYSFHRVGDLPLIVSVATATSEVYAAWRAKAVAISLALATLCSAATVLLHYFRREILLRIAAEHRLALVADTDGLTLIPNRRSFDLAFAEEWRRASRNQMPIALLLMDADFFKLFNDTYGHQAGDQVLCAIAGAIVRTIRRPADMAGRYGGEEFVALLPDTEMAGALKAAESLRAAIIDLAIPHIGSPFGGLTVSIGAAVMYPHPAEASATLLKMADEALYEAKRAGRNRVCARAAEYADAPAQPDPVAV